MTPSGIEPATFRLVAQCLNCASVPQCAPVIIIIIIIIIIIMCAQLHFNIRKETGMKLNKHRYDRVPKSDGTSYEVKVTILRNQQYKLTELLLTIMSDNEKGTCMLTLRRLMSYIYGAPILDVSRSHTTTQHSR